MNDKHTDECNRQKFTLDRPIHYRIMVAGQTSESWSDWADGMNVQVETNASGFTTTNLNGTMDQAALIGLLRQLYYLGLPLISVNCIQSLEKKNI
jgi:hypothetical protein